MVVSLLVYLFIRTRRRTENHTIHSTSRVLRSGPTRRQGQVTRTAVEGSGCADWDPRSVRKVGGKVKSDVTHSF
jgi:hypothetical protein